MGRVGKLAIEIPDKVKVTLKPVQGEPTKVCVEGPRGVLELAVPKELSVSVADRKISVIPVGNARRPHRFGPTDDRKIGIQGDALHGTIRALINNMVVGVTAGYTKVLVIEGMGYRASIDKGVLNLQIGYTNPIKYAPPAGIKIEVPNPQRIVIQGIDKRLVGDVAAEIRSFKSPEPYKGKGIRYEGEYIKKKAGKKAGYGTGAQA